MNDFLKCECSHCGQSMEFPIEGLGEIVPCPTCGKPVALISSNPSADLNSVVVTPAHDIVVPKPVQKREEKKIVRTILSKLTAETIRVKTQTGDTPLHRAAKTGKISEIPKHLLELELFMARNNSFSRETPLHLAAQHGHLDKVPREFLTKETLTASTEYEKKESKTGSTPPRTETPLHTAIRHGHADQIPKEFLKPEFLSIEASGYRLTVLHQLAYANRLDLVPDIYANSEIWNLRDSQGRTPREVLESVIERQAYVVDVRSQPATEKQKEKLRYFGYTFDEKISKGQASDALDKCARNFPEVDRTYYSRPATEEQLLRVREINKHPDCGPDEPFYDFENEGPLTYGKAKDILQEWGWLQRTKERKDDFRQNLISLVARIDFYPSLTVARVSKAAKALDEIYQEWMDDKDRQDLLIKKVVELNPELAAKEGWPTEEYKPKPESIAKARKTLEADHKSSYEHPLAVKHSNQDVPTEAQIKSLEGGLKLDTKANISASKLDALLKLEGQSPCAEDMELFARHGITLYAGDAFATRALADLVRCFEDMIINEGGYTNISMACVAASQDPSFKRAMITLNSFDQLVFTWPKHKLKQWHHKGAEY